MSAFRRRAIDGHRGNAGRAPLSSVWLLVDSSRVSGIETHLLELARELAKTPISVSVVFLADHGTHPMRSELDEAGVRHFSLDGTTTSLIRALKHHRPSLVHTHGYKAGILARGAAPLLRIPVVSTFHAGEPGRGRVRLYNAIDRLTARFATCIAVSESIRGSLPTGTRVIENFVQPPTEKTIGPSRGNLPVAFVGRVEQEKGPDEFCAIAEALPDIPFDVYGDGSMRATLEARYGERVCFHGMVPTMAQHWRNIGLLCMPSRHEGLPMALLEAMSHGVPVAAYAVGGLATSVLDGQTGWLAPSRPRR